MSGQYLAPFNSTPFNFANTKTAAGGEGDETSFNPNHKQMQLGDFGMDIGGSNI